MPSTFDWAARYRAGDTPWDLGRPHPALVERLAGLGPPGAALVPGCGRGHDALALAEAGWEVTAVDLVAEIEPALAAALGRHGGRFVRADALSFPPPEVDLLLDHTFLCALDLERRPEWGALVRRAVRPGGLVAALVFPADKPRADGGPPHGTTGADVLALLGPGFRCLADEPLDPAATGRRWAERWLVARRAAEEPA